MAYNLLVTLVSVFGLIQSIVWLGFSILAVLVYLCVLSISPYQGDADFYRVTIVKLYFEGPKCIPDGNYLGQFNEDYRNPEKISLTTPDIIFALMMVKIVFEFMFFAVSCLVLKARIKKDEKKMSKSVKNWSVLTLIVSALDLLLTVLLILDVFALTSYFRDQYHGEPIYQKIWYLPLIFGALSSRFVVLWLWNVIMAFCFLCNCIKTGKKASAEVEKCKPEHVDHSQATKSCPQDSEKVKRSLGFREESCPDIEVQSMEEIINFKNE